MIDNKLLEQRLILRESVAGASTSLFKCATKLCALKTSPANMKSLDGFLRELSLYKLDIDRSSRCIRSYNLQLEEYEELEADINAKITAATNEIDLLKEELKQGKEIRSYRQQIEAFAVEVNTLQKASSTKRKIADVEEGIDQVQQSLVQVEGEMGTRLGQVEKLMVMIRDLEEKLHEDENAEGEEEREESDRRGGRGEEEGGKEQAGDPEETNAEGDTMEVSE